MEPIIIVGSGLAGYTLARELRKLDAETPLAIVSADDGRFYSKPMLSNALAAGKSADALATADAARMAEQLNAEIATHARVEAIDPAARSIVVDGRPRRYRKLALALGADPVRPQLEGDGAAEVLSVNDLSDYARFRRAVEGKSRVAILGGGLIGCEFANDLVAAGYRVDLIHPAAHPLERLLPAPAGEALRDALARAGVSWHLNAGGARVDKTEGGYRLTLSDGATLEAEAVLSAIGLRPRTALAREAGIDTGRGIRVDRGLRTSAPDVYALGDCAEVEGLLLPFVMPLMQAARALAKTLAGTPAEVAYPAMPVVVKTPACPVAVAPPPACDGEWRIEREAEGICALFHDAEGRLRGFALTGAAAARRSALAQQLPAVLG